MDWPFDDQVETGSWQKFRAEGFKNYAYGCVYEGDKVRDGVPLGGLGTGYITLEGNGNWGNCTIFNEFLKPRQIGLPVFNLLREVKSIKYWGHFPFADLIGEISPSLRLGIRAFSPFALGDSASSNIPTVLFKIYLKNSGDKTARGEIIPQFVQGEGHCFLPEKMDYSIPPGETGVFKFVLVWFYPYFKDTSGEPHQHNYSFRFRDWREVAKYAQDNFDSLLEKSLAWQEEIYSSEYPAWLKDALVNGLYSLAKNTLWVKSSRPDNWYPDMGFFSHSESFTGCPISETMVCRIHGHFPILLFFPELEYSTLLGFKHFQLNNGEIPFCFGTGNSLRAPLFQCQHPLNSGQYVQMVYLYYLRTKDRKFLREFYPSVKKAIQYLKTLDYDEDGLVNEHPHALEGEIWPANQFYDIWSWYGTSAYVAGIGLASFLCAERIASLCGDKKFAEECAQVIEKGLKSFEEKLWNGEYYRLYNDEGKRGVSEICLANQLMGEWCARVAGMELFPPSRVKKALQSIKKLNFPLTEYGLVNAANPDGTPAVSRKDNDPNDHARQIFVGENLCAAMTFIYLGEKEQGMEIAKRVYEAVAFKHSPWNQHCLINAHDGTPVWGSDYYSNMAIWALPMALGTVKLPQAHVRHGA